ncbi:MAG: hypothetical protein LC791_10875 [Acidobacteria bacterium]|nr:hypothetical protein [Acidobacteriota bacterium]
MAIQQAVGFTRLLSVDALTFPKMTGQRLRQVSEGTIEVIGLTLLVVVALACVLVSLSDSDDASFIEGSAPGGDGASRL